MSKNPLVTIAVIACNEQENIVRTVSMLLAQSRTNYRLAEMLVVSDGSTDATVSLVRAFKSPIVKVISHRRRIGKVGRLNEIYKAFTNDILVVVDADIIFRDPFIIQRLVSALASGPRVGLACARHLALPPRTFVERLSYFGYRVWDSARLNLDKPAIRYFVEGGCRAFSSDFIQILRYPSGVPLSEDSYSFYCAVTHRFTVKVAWTAVVYHRLAYNYHDYNKQMKRFLKTSYLLAPYFSSALLAKYEVLTPGCRYRSLFKLLIRNPFTGLCYLFLQSWVKLQLLFYTPKIAWDMTRRSL